MSLRRWASWSMVSLPARSRIVTAPIRRSAISRRMAVLLPRTRPRRVPASLAPEGERRKVLAEYAPEWGRRVQDSERSAGPGLGWRRCSRATTPSSSARATTASSRRPISPAPAGKCWCSSAATLVGGCVVTEELWPGFKVSTASYVNSLFRPEIIRDLDLKRHGFAMLPRSPSSFTPLPDGRSLLMGPDKAMTHREVSKFSTRDADSLPRFEAMLERVAAFLEPTLVETPPNPWSSSPRNLTQLAQLAWQFRGARRRRPEGDRNPHRRRQPDPRPLVRVGSAEDDARRPTPSSAPLPRRRCRAPPTCCSITSWASATACAACGATCAAAWARLSNAIAAAARERGAEIEVNAAVARILVEDGRAAGVVLANGDEVRAPRVVSSLDAQLTFLRLMDAADLPADVPRVGDAPRLRERQLQDQPGAVGSPRTSPACRAVASGRSTTARSTSAPTAPTSKGPTTAPSTATSPSTRSSKRRCRARSTTRWRRTGST